MMRPVLTYTGGELDRAGGRRLDPDWVRTQLEAPEARVIPLWRGRCLVRRAAAAATADPRFGGAVRHGAADDVAATRDAAPVLIPVTEAAELLDAVGEPVFLGLQAGAGVFAADLSALDEAGAIELVEATGALDVRALVASLSPPEAATLAYARGILHWHRHQRFCGVCGDATESRHGGHVRACRRENCGTLFFPRIEPAVIVLVEAPDGPDRCLLARHRGAADGAYAALAGFVEIGESLEDAVRREVAEETGVHVDTVRYQASQAWPFPAGLMIGFRARAASDTITVDRDELEEARWFTRSELRTWIAAHRGTRNLFNADSIEKYLIDAWMQEENAQSVGPRGP